MRVFCAKNERSRGEGENLCVYVCKGCFPTKDPRKMTIGRAEITMVECSRKYNGVRRDALSRARPAENADDHVQKLSSCPCIT